MNQNASAKVWNGIPVATIISLVSALLYGASPIDLIFDVVPLIGLVDDIFIVPLLLLIGGIAFFRHKKLAPKPAYAKVTTPGQESGGEVVPPPANNLRAPKVPQRRP
ncbi:MAG: YkvA family protein [Fimbriimonadaceae bacterium]|jgi:hypothetical protein|nr:YkvA family protein [Fimbriimonadaceae bacterium]